MSGMQWRKIGRCRRRKTAAKGGASNAGTPRLHPEREMAPAQSQAQSQDGGLTAQGNEGGDASKTVDDGRTASSRYGGGRG